MSKRDEAARQVIERAQQVAARKGKSTEKARREAAEQLRKAHREQGN